MFAEVAVTLLAILLAFAAGVVCAAVFFGVQREPMPERATDPENPVALPPMLRAAEAVAAMLESEIAEMERIRPEAVVSHPALLRMQRIGARVEAMSEVVVRLTRQK